MDKITIEARMYLSEDNYNYSENIADTDSKWVKLYTDWGNLSSSMDNLKVEYGQGEALFEIIKDDSRTGLFEDLKDILEGADVLDRDAIITEFFEEEYLQEKFYDEDIIEKIDFLKNNNVASNWSDYDYVSVNGYSQGDQREVLINMKEAEEVWGKRPDLNLIKKDISNYMYDSPMNLRLYINDEEYILEGDGWYDDYDFNNVKNQCFEIIKHDFPELEDEMISDALDDVLPTVLEYESSYDSTSTSIYLVEKEKSSQLEKIVKSHEDKIQPIKFDAILRYDMDENTDSVIPTIYFPNSIFTSSITNETMIECVEPYGHTSSSLNYLLNNTKEVNEWNDSFSALGYNKDELNIIKVEDLKLEEVESSKNKKTNRNR